MRLTRAIIAGCLGVLAGVFSCAGQKLNWTWSSPQPHGNDVAGMAWNGSLGVQVCDSGQVYTSPDLIHWTPQKSNLTNDLEAVAFFGRRIIVTGARGAVAYSDDGTNFVASSLNTANWLVDVAASPGLVVAVGDNGALYTSTDGAHWALQPAPPNIYENWLLSVAYGNGTWVITGEGGYIATSSNGTNWSSGSSLNAATYGDLEKVAWCNGSGSASTFPYKGFWIVTDNYNYAGTSAALYSVNNGSSWVPVSFATGAPTNVLYTIAADNATTLLAGESVARLGATVGGKVAWPEAVGASSTNVPPGTYFAAVLQTNGAYALAGYDGMLVESTNTGAGYAWNEP